MLFAMREQWFHDNQLEELRQRTQRSYASVIKFLTSRLLAFLCTGNMWACFQQDGNAPLDKDERNKRYSGTNKQEICYFKNDAGIPSRPGLFDDFN